MADFQAFVRTWSARGPLILSAGAIGVLALALTTGWGKGPPGDEGAAAHLWQLLIGLQLPLIALFLAAADWGKPWGVLKILGLQVALLAVAMAPVYIMEHMGK
jgi:hypothetical protein